MSKKKSDLAALHCQDATSQACLADIKAMKEGLGFINNQDKVENYLENILNNFGVIDLTDEDDVFINEFGVRETKKSISVPRSVVDDIPHQDETHVRFVEYENLNDLSKYVAPQQREEIESYLGSKDYEYTNQPFLDKPYIRMYALPSLQTVGGGLTAVAGAAVTATTWETGVGAVAGVYMVGSGADDVYTGINNFGVEPGKQDVTAREKILQSLGMSESSAAWTALGLDVASGVGAIGAVSKANKVVVQDAHFLDSSTAAGDTVSHSKISTAVGDDANTLNNYKNSTDTGDGHIVLAHGALNYDELGGIPVINGKPTNVAQIAEAVRSNPNYVEGSQVCFASCWSGTSGTAQELADQLKAPVFAPTRPVAWDTITGKWVLDTEVRPKVVNPEIKPEWKMFYPTKSK